MPLTHDIGVRIPYPLPRETVIVAFFITDSPEQRDKGRRTPFEQTEQRDPDELRSSRRVVTFEDRRSEINSLSTTENNCNRSLFILHSKAPAQKPESDSSRMRNGAMRKSFISTQDNGSRQRKKRSFPSSARTPCRKFIGTKNSPESEQRKS